MKGLPPPLCESHFNWNVWCHFKSRVCHPYFANKFLSALNPTKTNKF